ncbi:GNAT family N-acetyltransferase [Solicola gregarius]|uniref:N-acetyltransferase domain-containing protein n=1 Tax=Solicola gregarius TaxID=2908642 RepID=A0AA46TEM2_9ACTN|nr:hypothetical protein [Solicola gregarius]UYM03820.1 hypothetical protein L0C25_14860 [Solicola gregarius]
MTIETVDLFDDTALREAHDVTLADAAARPYATPWTWQEYRTAARTPDPWSVLRMLGARAADGVLVGVAEAWFPQRDNTTMVWADLSILPSRADDVGVAALLDAFHDLARRHGRSAVHVMAGVSRDERTSPKSRALESAGYGLLLTNAHRILELPIDVDEMGSLSDAVAARHAAYRIIAWHGTCPEQWIDEYADLRARILLDAPDGGAGFEREDYDAERVRHEEAELEAQERVLYTAIAIAPDGAVAGHSQLVVPGTDEANAFQWDTLVLAAHRGHRLGIALKARNLGEAADAFGPRTVLHTFNAEENAPMIAVNERLGFRLVDYLGEFRIEL